MVLITIYYLNLIKIKSIRFRLLILNVACVLTKQTYNKARLNTSKIEFQKLQQPLQTIVKSFTQIKKIYKREDVYINIIVVFILETT